MPTPKLRLITTNKELSTTNYSSQPMNVNLADGRYVSAGAIITSQITANSLPSVRQKTQARAHKRRVLVNTRLRLVATQSKEIATDCMAA